MKGKDAGELFTALIRARKWRPEAIQMRSVEDPVSYYVGVRRIEDGKYFTIDDPADWPLKEG